MKRNREQLTVPPAGRPLAGQPQWRQDFPIDWPQDQYVSRRDFTKFMVLTSLAFVVGQMWIVAQSVLRRRRPANPGQRIIALAGLPVGGAKDQAGQDIYRTYAKAMRTAGLRNSCIM